MYKKLLEEHKSIFITLFLAVFLMSGFYYYTHQDQITKNRQLSSISSVPAILVADDKLLILDPITKSVNCQINESLPDHGCTPGAIFKNASKEIICVPGYTKTVRSVSASIKKRVYAQYNIAYPAVFGSYELDHLIPLELGGSNDQANLFPEAANPAPGFKEKDLVENYLHNEVCAGHIYLSVAQEKITSNWLSVYESLTPDQIKALKQQYQSWTH